MKIFFSPLVTAVAQCSLLPSSSTDEDVDVSRFHLCALFVVWCGDRWWMTGPTLMLRKASNALRRVVPLIGIPLLAPPPPSSPSSWPWPATRASDPTAPTGWASSTSSRTHHRARGRTPRPQSSGPMVRPRGQVASNRPASPDLPGHARREREQAQWDLCRAIR